MKRGLLFDLDGVLVDTGELHWQAWQALAAEDPFFHMSKKQFVSSFGQRNESIFEQVCKESSPKQREQWALRKEHLFRERVGTEMALLPGVEAFLERVAERRLPRIIASSAPVDNLCHFLEKTRLRHYFDTYVSGEEVERGKPFPDVFLMAATRLHVPPEQCIVFEDSLAGLQAGRLAGALVVAVTTTHPQEALSGYDTVVDRLDELDLEELLTL